MSYASTNTHRFQVHVKYIQFGSFVLPKLFAHVLRGKGNFTQDDERALALCVCKAQTRHQLFLAHLGRFVVLFLEVSHLSPPTGDGMRWLERVPADRDVVSLKFNIHGAIG